MEASAYLRMAYRWWWLLLVAALVAGATAYAASSLMVPTYRATAMLLVVQQEVPGLVQRSDLETSALLANTFSRLITIRPLLEEVIEQGEFAMSVEELQKAIAIEHPRASQILEITAKANDPERARDLANIVASVFIESKEAQLASRAGIVSIVDPAVTPRLPISPRRPLNAAIGALLGVTACALFLTLYEYRDDTVKTPEEVRQATRLPTLGHLRDFGRVAAPEHRLQVALYPRSALAEEYRTVRTNLSAALGVDESGRYERKVVLLASAATGEGKSTAVANLAVMFGTAGHRVLLLDADLREPTLHTIFSVDDRSGLTTLLLNDAQEATRTTFHQNLALLPAGPIPVNPAELLGSARMRAILHDFREQYDIILIDTPPVLEVTDAAVLARLADAIVIVAWAGRTRGSELRSAVEQFAGAGRPIAGVLLNRTARERTAVYRVEVPATVKHPVLVDMRRAAEE